MTGAGGSTRALDFPGTIELSRASLSSSVKRKLSAPPQSLFVGSIHQGSTQPHRHNLKSSKPLWFPACLYSDFIHSNGLPAPASNLSTYGTIQRSERTGCSCIVSSKTHPVTRRSSCKHFASCGSLVVIIPDPTVRLRRRP